MNRINEHSPIILLMNAQNQQIKAIHSRDHVKAQELEKTISCLKHQLRKGKQNETA